MEPESSLPHSQVPATCPYPEPARFSPYPHIPLPEDPSYLANSLAAAESEPALYKLLTFHLPNFMSFFRCLGRTKLSIQVRCKCSRFTTKPVFKVMSCQHLVQIPSWRNTPCRLSTTTFSTYSQLHSILEAVPLSAICGRAKPW